MLGLCLVMISIPGYLDTPNMITQMIHSFTGSFTGSIPGTSGGSMLHQMGYPSRTVIIPLVQYSFIGLAVTGIGLVVFGSVAKKTTKVTVNLVSDETEETEKVKKINSPQFIDEPEKVKKINSPQFIDERTQTNLRSLRILQERLARGEITAKEFQNLKHLME